MPSNGGPRVDVGVSRPPEVPVTSTVVGNRVLTLAEQDSIREIENLPGLSDDEKKRQIRAYLATLGMHPVTPAGNLVNNAQRGTTSAMVDTDLNRDAAEDQERHTRSRSTRPAQRSNRNYVPRLNGNRPPFDMGHFLNF